MKLKYEWKSKSGIPSTAGCDYVRFMPGHVVFWVVEPGRADRIVIAVVNEQCNGLIEVGEVPSGQAEPDL